MNPSQSMASVYSAILPKIGALARTATAILSTYLLVGCVLADSLAFSDAVLGWTERKYGSEARRRVVALQELVEAGVGLEDRAKLERVNTFFNRVSYDSDYALWDRKDY